MVTPKPHGGSEVAQGHLLSTGPVATVVQPVAAAEPATGPIPRNGHRSSPTTRQGRCKTSPGAAR